MVGFFGLFSQMMIKLQNKSNRTIEMYCYLIFMFGLIFVSILNLFKIQIL